VAKFSKSRVWDKVPEGSAVIFEGTQTFLQHSVGLVDGNSYVKKQLYSFICFNRTPTCDGRTDRHRTTEYTMLAKRFTVKRGCRITINVATKVNVPFPG